MSYMSGEPVPPGFEDELRSSVIQKQIDIFNGGPLVGTEYAVELHEDGQSRPDYFCVLCNTFNNSRSVFIHWTSVTHRTNYVKTHYQKAFEVLQQMRRTSSNSNEVLNATTKLVQSIENHHGRNVHVMSVAGQDFRRFRTKICSQVRDKIHYDECNGPNFVDQLRGFSSHDSSKSGGSGIALDAISSDDDDNFSLSVSPQSMSKKLRKKQDEQQPAYRLVNRSPPLIDGDNKVNKSNPSAGIKQTLPTPKELSMQAAQIAQERYKWEKFQCMLELQLKQLRDDNEIYESNPDKHPDYSEEWKLFWNRRYKQLQEEKKCDPNSYDYKPEWISFWKDRRVELFNIAATKIKKDLQEKFKLGDNTNMLLERYKIRVQSPKNSTGSTTSGSSGVGGVSAGRRKPNYRGPNNRGENGAGPSDAVIDISDDEQSPAQPSVNRPSRRPPYGHSPTRSESPKRGRSQGTRLVCRSRTRSPLPGRHRGRSRSHTRSRSPLRHNRDRSHHSRSHDDYGDRERERDRGRDRDCSNGDYYRDRDEYTRSTRSYEPMESFRVLDSRNYPEYSQPGQRTDSPMITKTSVADKEKENNEEAEGPLTVVTVLRMLSALEDHLGSMGPKVLNMLSKALAMEKIKPNTADDLLLNEDNCVFMETIKEKLKGILIAEVLDDQQKVRVVKKLISNIATVIFQVTSKGAKQSSQIEPKHGEFDKKRREYQLPFDRQLVSSKLAGALISNGVDDLSIDDMNRLIHFHTLLTKTNHGLLPSGGLTFNEVPLHLGLPGALPVDNDYTSISSDLEIDLRELMKEVEQQLANKAGIEDTTTTTSTNKSNSANDPSAGMESLTDSDLKTLLQNFKFLSSEEQVHLIEHLRKLEKLQPTRVESLRKYVNIAELSSDGESCSDYLSRVIAIGQRGAAGVKAGSGSDTSRSTSTAGSRATLGAPTATLVASGMGKSLERHDDPMTSSNKYQGRVAMRNSPNFMIDDDEDDDDYNFDDLLMKANDSNGKCRSPTFSTSSSMLSNNIVPVQSSPNALTFKPAPPKISLKDTENIIANLMGTLSNNSSQHKSQQQQQQHQKQQHQKQQQKQQHPQQQQLHSQQHQQHPQTLQQRNQQPCVPNNAGNAVAGGAGRYYNYGGDQSTLGNQNNLYSHQPQQQQQHQQHHQAAAQQQSYNMGNYNSYGQQQMSHTGYGSQINPWANNGPPQTYNNMSQNYMHPQQQQQMQQQQQQQQSAPSHYGNNMFAGHQ